MTDLTDLAGLRPIGLRDFLDGYARVVSLDADDREFILDDDGTRVYGTWLVPADEPVVVQGREG
jgi:hypothetical protein